MLIELNHLKPHPRQNELFTKLDGDAYRDFLTDVRNRGIVQPVIVSDRTGELVICDGHQRVRAAIDAGLKAVPAEVRTFADEPEEVRCLVMNNVQRRQLSREEVSNVIAYWLANFTHHSNKRIADEIGVDDETVEAKRQTMEATSEIRKLDKLEGKDGKLRPRTVSRKPPPIKPPSKNYRQAQKAVEALFDLAVDDLAAAMREPHDTSLHLATQCQSVLELVYKALIQAGCDTN